MPTHLFLLPSCLLAWALAGCAAPRDTVASTSAPRRACFEHLDAGDVFERHELDGVFVLRDERGGCLRTTDAALARTPFCPQSSFKIANALIGLETRAISGEGHLWRWDGAPRALPAWERDLDLSGALSESCVPCFQEVARAVGAARMQAFLDTAGYGNRDISGPIDSFWLGDGPLRITPRGQVEFVHRSLAGELPIAPERVALVWRLLQLERGVDFTLHGKTGLGEQEGRAIGWFVGYVERGGHRFVYATLVRGQAGADIQAESRRLIPLRRSITRELLERAQVLPGL